MRQLVHSYAYANKCGVHPKQSTFDYHEREMKRVQCPITAVLRDTMSG